MPDPLEAPVELIEVNRIPQHVFAIRAEQIQYRRDQGLMRIVRADVRQPAVPSYSLGERPIVQTPTDRLRYVRLDEFCKIPGTLAAQFSVQVAGAKLHLAEPLARYSGVLSDAARNRAIVIAGPELPRPHLR